MSATVTSSLSRITALAKEQASGELICASDSVEVHVYLQRGRIAWATDSAQPLAFTRHLLERAQIDVEVFREILESCRREKRPLGETLIAWGAATKEEVRDALRHQIELALAKLHQSGPVQSLFLKRTSQFADYDAELTFALEELLVKAGPQIPMTRSRLMAAIAVDGPNASPLLRLRAQLDGILWAEMLEGTTPIEWFPEANAQTPRSAAEVTKNTLLDGASLVAMRSATGTLAGVALTPTRSLWCRVDDKFTVGELLSTLTSFQPEAVFPPNEPTTNAGRLWSFGPSLPDVETAMRELLQTVPELSGLFITDPATPKSTYGVGRMTVSSQDLVTLIERRAHAFGPDQNRDSADIDGEGMTSRRAMTTEAQFLLYAAEIIVGDRPRFVWLTLDRSSSKGIGWGYLTTLGRTMIRALKGA